MRSHKGIGGFLRKKQGMTHQTEMNKEKTTGEKVKKKVKKILMKSVLNKKVNKV